MNAKILMTTLLVVLFTCISYGQTVTINDADFKTYLLTLVDAANGGNGDGEVQVSEAEAFTGNVVYMNQGLTDPTGIEAFVNIAALALSDNTISSIDVSPFTQVTNLALANTGISILDVTALSFLERLTINDNSLSTLDLSNNGNLERLLADNNLLSSITFGDAPYHTIDCTNNLMESVTINGASGLDYFDFVGNQLTSASVINCNINQLRLNNNSISSLDLTSSTVTRFVLSDNNLSAVDFTGLNPTQVYISNNPNITSVSVSGLTNTTLFHASGTGLTSLDLTSNSALEELILYDSPIEHLDLTNQLALTYFDMGGDPGGSLKSLNIQNGNNSSMTLFDARNNDNLTCIEVDDVTYSNNNWSNKPAGASYSAECLPELISSTVTDDGIYPSAILTCTLTFSEEVVVNRFTNNFILYRAANGSNINMNGFITDIGDDFVTFIFQGLGQGQDYAIKVDPVAVEDLDGNYYAGIEDNTTMNFTAEWDEPVHSFNPAFNATGVSVDPDLEVSFDRNIEAGFVADLGGNVVTLRVTATSAIVEQVTISDPEISLSASSMTYSPSITLDYNTMYSVLITSGTVQTQGSSGEIWSGINSINGPTSWVFTTESEPDLTAPSPLTYSPEDNTIEVDRSTNIVLTFDEDIASGSGTIRLGYVGFPGQRFADYDVPSAPEVTISGDQLIINPATDLPEGTEYYVSIPEGVIEDLSGNAFGGFTDEETWSFTTIDDVAPSHTSLSPSHESTYGWLSTIVGMVFNEDVQEGSGTVSLYEADGTLVETVTTGVGDTRISFPATFRNNINFDAEYEELAEYYVVVSAGAFEDLAGNPHAGLAAHEWSFTANARPHISSLSPPDNATDIGTDATFTLTFDQGVWSNSEAELHIKDYDTDALIESISIADMDFGSGVVEIVPTPLAEGVHAYIVLAAGEIASSNNSEIFIGLDDKDDWDFTTLIPDTDPPAVTAVSPADDETHVSINTTFSITFDEEIQLQEGALLFMLRREGVDWEDIHEVDIAEYTLNGNEISFSFGEFNSGADYSTEYSISVSGITDLAGNAYIGHVDDVTWNFTTEEESDITPPALISLSPEDDAVDVELDAAFVASFDEDIKVLGDEQVVVLYKEGNVDRILNDDDSQLVVEGTTLTIDFTEDLLPGTDYSIWIKSTVSDLNDNYYTDHDQFTTWNFTTEDIMTIVEVSPGLNATDVALDADLVATFNHDIVVANPEGRIWVRDNQGYAMWGTINESDKFTISGNTLTMHLAAGNAQPISEYYFNIEENTIANAEGTFYTDGVIMVDGEVWRFTTGKADQNISITPIDDKLVTDASFEIEASTDSGLELTYAIEGPATLDGTIVSLTGTVGTVTITVSQAGNENYNSASESESFEVSDSVIEMLDQTITFEVLPDKVYGDEPFDLAATASSGLEVDFSMVEGPVTLDGNSVTIIGAGEVTIAADQPGDENFNAAPQVTRSFTIAKAEQTISITSINDKLTTDAPFMITATVDTGLPLTYAVSGPATVSENGTISLEGTVGTVTVTVSQVGDDNYLDAEESLSFEVTEPVTELEDQTITFELLEDRAFGDDPFVLSAIASSDLDVEFSVVSGPIEIDGNEVTILGAGEAVIAADQPGDESFNAAPQVTQAFTINKADQIISFEAIADKTFGDDDFNLSGSASSGLDLTYMVIMGPATVNGSMVTITGAGEIEIGASQAGDNNYNAANQVTQSFTVSKADQVISIETIADKTTVDGPFDVVASTTSGLDLTYSVEGPASIDGATITLDGTAGTVTIMVSQVGDDNYNSSTASTSFEVMEETVASVADEISLIAYPNPASGWINIKGNSARVEVQIFDLDGKLLIKEKLMGEEQLSVQTLRSGLYLLRVIENQNSTTQQLLIRK